ncbi:hypothetical protein EDD86DRAFT_118315 [Gorgonomyces haynaldii]|nr:hypothetical protein EDD86DRAFT_118315 [Gorgonomyces haynaldii]
MFRAVPPSNQPNTLAPQLMQELLKQLRIDILKDNPQQRQLAHWLFDVARPNIDPHQPLDTKPEYQTKQPKRHWYQSSKRQKKQLFELKTHIGAHLLCQDNPAQVVPFLQRMAGQGSQMPVSYLLEMSLWQVAVGQTMAAYEHLSAFLSLYPYNESALLHGYCGYMCCILVKEGDERYRESGIQHLEDSLKLDHQFFFFKAYVDLLNDSSVLGLCRRSIAEHRDVVHIRLAADILKKYNDPEVYDILLILFQMDPMMDVEDVQVLVRHCVETKKEHQVIPLLLERLDYREDDQVWSLLRLALGGKNWPLGKHQYTQDGSKDKMHCLGILK